MVVWLGVGGCILWLVGVGYVCFDVFVELWYFVGVVVEVGGKVYGGVVG